MLHVLFFHLGPGSWLFLPPSLCRGHLEAGGGEGRQQGGGAVQKGVPEA